MSNYTTELDGPLFEPVTTSSPTAGLLPGEWRDKVMVDVIHDGAFVPSFCLFDAKGRDLPEATWHERYMVERDWGAGIVADALASALGLKRWWRVNIARVVMDFGRFPGSTPPAAMHLQRFAINYPFSTALGSHQKRRILEEYYDGISRDIERVVARRVLKLAIHTYDPYSANGLLRAPISLITRVHGLHSDEVRSAFDPLYPSALGSWTADRVLRNRISLTVEKAGFGVAHNFPYTLPEGSIEVRAQVWRFFYQLRKRFCEVHPDSAGDSAYSRVWDMLLDTNQRSTDCAALRSYVHHFQRPPVGQEAAFAASQRAYEKVADYVETSGFVRQYRYAQDRPSAMAIEIRKDLVYEFEDGVPVRPRYEFAEVLGQAIAQAVQTYLLQDLPERMDRPMTLGLSPVGWPRPEKESPGA